MSFQVDSLLAYLDPGTGSLIAQFLIAGIISATAVFSGSITRVKRFFNRSASQTGTSQQLLPSINSESSVSEAPQRRHAA